MLFNFDSSAKVKYFLNKYEFNSGIHPITVGPY